MKKNKYKNPETKNISHLRLLAMAIGLAPHMVRGPLVVRGAAVLWPPVMGASVVGPPVMWPPIGRGPPVPVAEPIALALVSRQLRAVHRHLAGLARRPGEQVINPRLTKNKSKLKQIRRAHLGTGVRGGSVSM